jgi:hypothetical protein
MGNRDSTLSRSVAELDVRTDTMNFLPSLTLEGLYDRATIHVCIYTHSASRGQGLFDLLGRPHFGSPERGCGMVAMGRQSLSRRGDRVVGKVAEDQLHFESFNPTRVAVTTTHEHPCVVFGLTMRGQHIVFAWLHIFTCLSFQYGALINFFRTFPVSVLGRSVTKSTVRGTL